MIRIFVLILSLSIINSCSETEQVYSRQILSFGTQIDVTLFGIEKAEADLAILKIEAELDLMHNNWHAWHKSSITKLNKQLQSGTEFTVDSKILPLIIESKRLYTQSDGLFNPAIGKLIELWGFYKDDPSQNKSLPSDKSISELVKSKPSMDDIVINGHQLKGLNSDIQLDFGGYAKGYGVDALVEQLKNQGIHNALINAGGDIKGIGNIGQRPWRIAIQHPAKDQALGWLDLNPNESIFTSGDYRRNYTIENQQYHHIIDPRTGYPSKHAHSVTVVHSSGAIADAAATALMVATPAEWLKIAKQIGLKHLLIVDKNGQLYADELFISRIHLLGQKSKIKRLGLL